MIDYAGTREERSIQAVLFRRDQTFGLSLVILIFLGGLVACDDRPVVDMSAVVEGGAEGLSDARPALRIAVAARISPESTRDLYDSLLDRVANGVGRRAIFSQRRTYAEVNALLEAKEVDLAFVCAGPYTDGHDAFGMELLVVPLVRGQALYRGYIIAAADSPVRSLEDLKGRRFAFTDPDSNTGHLVPRFMLSERGETLGSFFSETFFTYSHDASVRAVAEGQADGAAVDSLVWDYFDETESGLTSRTRIIERSPAFGIPPVVVHPDLDEQLKETLRAEFLGLHEDPGGKQLLDGLQIDRFSRGEDSAYDSVRQMRSRPSPASGKGSQR